MVDRPHAVRVTVEGVVQGLGVRPAVHRWAVSLGLAGSVRNRRGALEIEVQGREDQVARFVAGLAEALPALAHVASVHIGTMAPQEVRDFSIVASDAGGPAASCLVPDVGICDACEQELCDPTNRRYRYPLIACAACGPRWTVLRRLPWDRDRTTYADFPPCEVCRRESEDPSDRRFHAVSICCATCGPTVRLVGADGGVAEAGRMLRQGAILAVKGMGGYHLVCDATSEGVVNRLRARKRRPTKPFAVCVPSPLHPRMREPCRPVVLLPRPDLDLADAVAPGSGTIGLLLPSTGTQRLLLEVAGRPLVMTSGNLSGEPMAWEDDDAQARLGSLVDAMLVHDLKLMRPCDDPVICCVGAAPIPIRRARGAIPQPTRLPVPLPFPTLAVGGQFASTVALGTGDVAVVGPHGGDLDTLAALARLPETVEDLQRLLDLRPAGIVHDLHPDYATTQFARARATAGGLRILGVQHHHAHFAAALTEHGRRGPALGICWDGTGYGLDGTAWGGEFLVGDLRAVRRVAHLRPIRLPGGDAAVRAPWRTGASLLSEIGEDPGPLAKVPGPWVSSVGRLLDGIAALLGLVTERSWDGEPPARLEQLARQADDDGVRYPASLDWRPMVACVARDLRAGVDRAVIARRVHHALVDLAVSVAEGHALVALTGGVFVNRLLADPIEARLRARGATVLRHRAVPPGDGGLSLGQLSVAAAIWGS